MVAQLAVTRLVRLYHSAPKSQLGWDNLPCEISRCQKNAEGRRTWSIGKLDAGINSAKLVIRARSRPIFRRCSVFIRPTLAELIDIRSSRIMTGENSANVAINSLMRRRNFRQPSFVLMAIASPVATFQISCMGRNCFQRSCCFIHLPSLNKPWQWGTTKYRVDRILPAYRSRNGTALLCTTRLIIDK